MIKQFDHDEAKLKFDHRELKLLHQLLSHNDHHDGEAWLLIENMDQKVENALAQHQHVKQQEKFKYALTIQTLSKTATIETKHASIAKLWQTILQIDQFDTFVHVSGSTLGQQLAWYLKQLADNQSYRNRDNWLGTVDDWLLNFDLSWHQILDGDVDNSYPYVNWLVYLWDWIVSVNDREHTSINMHDPDVTDAQFMQIGELLFDQNELLYHLNEPQTKFKLTKAPLKGTEDND